MAKITKIPAPLLVIGLGGTGSDAALRLKREFRERYEMDKNPDGSYKDVPPKTRFLIIDTDDSMAGPKKDWSDTEFCPIVADVTLAQDPGRRNPWENTWFTQDFRDPDGHLTSGNGAGVYRQISRLFLMRNADRVISRMRSAIIDIGNVNAGDPKARRIHVVVLAGISGGTGSGTFLDVAYLVRHAIGNADHHLELALVMPDVTIARHALTKPQFQQLYSINAYAALTELDFWMSHNSHKHRYRQQYSNLLTIDWDKAPYNDVILMSSQMLDGTNINNPYEHVMNVIGEYYANWFADDEAQRIERFKDKKGDVTEQKLEGNELQAAKAYSFESARSNELAALSTMRQEYPTPYRYRSIGAFSNSGDDSSILDMQWNLVYDAAGTVNEEKLALLPSGRIGEIGEALIEKHIGMMRGEYESQLHPIPDVFIGKDAGVIAGVDFDAAPNGLDFDLYRKGIENAKGEDAKFIADKVKQEIERMMREIIVDLDKGPGCAFETLKHPESGVIQQLKDLKNELTNKLRDATAFVNEYSGQQGRAELSRQDFIRGGLFKKRGLYVDYQGKVNDLYNAMQAKGYYTAALDALDGNEKRDGIIRFAEKYMTLLGEMCTGLAEVREEYNRRCENVGTDGFRILRRENVLGSLTAQFKQNDNDVAATRAVFTAVADGVEQGIKQDLLRYSSDEVAKYIRSAMEDLRKTTFVGIANMNLDDRIREFADTEAVASVQDYAEHVLMPRMENGSRPMFGSKIDLADALGNAVEQYIGVVPQSAANLMAGITNYLSHQNKTFNIKASSVGDRIFWVSSVTGFPLCDYYMLDDLRQYYLGTKGTGGHSAFHLCMASDADEAKNGLQCQNWKKLPNITCPRIRDIVGNEARAQALEQAGVLKIDIDWDPVNYTADVKATYKCLHSDAAYITVEEMQRKIDVALSGTGKMAALEALRAGCDDITIEFGANKAKDKAEAWARVLGLDDTIQIKLESTLPEQQRKQIMQAWETCYRRVVYEYLGRCAQLLTKMEVNRECFDLIDKAMEPDMDALKKNCEHFALMYAYGKVNFTRRAALFVSPVVTEENDAFYNNGEDYERLSKIAAGVDDYPMALKALLYYVHVIRSNGDTRDGMIDAEVKSISDEINVLDRKNMAHPEIETFVENARALEKALVDAKLTIGQLRAANKIGQKEYDDTNAFIDAVVKKLKLDIYPFK